MSVTTLPHDGHDHSDPIRSRSPHSANSYRELEAVAEIRLGEAHAQRGGTIIPIDEEPSNRLNEHEAIGFGDINPPSKRRRPPAAPPPDLEQDETLIDLIVMAIQGFVGFFSQVTSVIDEEEGDTDEIDVDWISDQEIDNLALFQGNLKEFVQLHEGQIAPRKIHRMINMLMTDDHPIWEQRCRQLLPSATFHNHLIQIQDSSRAKLKAFLGTWNPLVDHCSENIYVLDDHLTAHRIPVVNQTDGVRSKLGVMSGLHAWDMRVTGPIGSHFTVGVGTEKCQLQTKAGYVSLIGDDKESWGWDVVWGNVSHKGKTIGDYPKAVIYEYTPGDIIRLILDCDEGHVSFAVNEMSFGIAFTNLPKDVPLYPTVGLVYGNIEVTLIYLGVPPPLRN